MARYAKAFGLLCLVLLFIVCTMVVAQVRLVSSAAGASSPTTAENSWATKAPMAQARANLGIAVVNGKIYAIGGDTLSGPWVFSMGFAGRPTGGVVGTNEEYDPALDKWTSKAPMRTPRTGFAIAAYQNKIYCIGGATNRDIYSGPTLTDVNEVYNPATDNWETKSSMPKATWQVQANVVNGKIYVVDWDGKNYVYDTATDSWSTKASTPSPSAAGFYGVSAVVDGKIHIIGGPSNLHQIYDPETDTWSNSTPPPNSIGGNPYYGGVAAGATTAVMAPKRIYVFGGYTQVYDPATDNWAVGASMPSSRISMGVAVVNDTLYAIGGGAADIGLLALLGLSQLTSSIRRLGMGRCRLLLVLFRLKATRRTTCAVFP